jgi:hypothetical protein
MNNITIAYRFRLPDNTQEEFSLELDSQTLELVSSTPYASQQWTRLDFHQCPNCPLNSSTHPDCPLSLKLVDIVKPFDHIMSYETIHVDVITRERRISQQTSAQKGLSSLMGLVIASSGCPHTAFFRPMARFHLPLSSVMETIYRATSMYLLSQYFLLQNGRDTDFDLKGLEQIYDNIREVNIAVARRLRHATEADSSVNAIVILDAFAMAMPTCIEESLNDLQHLFTPYLQHP